MAEKPVDLMHELCRIAIAAHYATTKLWHPPGATMAASKTMEIPELFEPGEVGGLTAAPCSPLGEVRLDLPENHYRTIVIDPPWPGPGEHRSAKGGGVSIIPYSTMTGIQLAAMRIPQIATPDSQLWIWTTSRNFVDAGLLLQMWGYRYAGMFIWKKPPNLGPWIRHDSEFIFRGVLPGVEIKLPAPVQTHEWPRPKRHSEKPAEAYRMIEEYSAEPRLDIFARQPRPGFDAWGNQVPDNEATNRFNHHV